LKRLSQLDGIRGLAVALVILVHLPPLLGIGIGRNLFSICLYRVLHVGWLGVDIFFVLSGFLITGIIVKDRSKQGFWSGFYMRRSFRILPAFIVVFVITLLIAHFFLPQIHTSSWYLLAATFFMANWTVITDSEMPMLGHLWSLAVEEQFYFLWPQAAKRLKSTSILKLALSLAVISELLRITLATLHVNAYIVYKITPTSIDGLSIGAALAVGITLPPVHRFLAVWWQRIALIAAALLPLAYLALRGSLFVFNVWSQVLAIPPVIVLTAMLIYGAIESALPPGLARFLGSPVMTYLGRRSYALYLIHVPVLIGIERSRADGALHRLPAGAGINAVLTLSAIAVALLLAELSWRIIESPAQNLRRRLMRGKEDDTPAHPSEEAAITQLSEENRLPGVVKLRGHENA